MLYCFSGLKKIQVKKKEKTYRGKPAVLLLVHCEKTVETRVDDLLQVIKTNEKFLT